MAKKQLAPLDLRAELQASGSAGSSGQVLVSGGAGTPPVWQTVAGVGTAFKEPVVAAGGLSVSGTTIPNFLSTVAGDVVMADAS